MLGVMCQWSLLTQQVQHMPRLFFSWILFWQPLLFAQYVYLDVSLYYAAVQTWSTV